MRNFRVKNLFDLGQDGLGELVVKSSFELGFRVNVEAAFKVFVGHNRVVGVSIYVIDQVLRKSLIDGMGNDEDGRGDVCRFNAYL